MSFIKESVLFTKNIDNSIQEYAAEQNCSLDKLDFTLLGLQTYFKGYKNETFIKFHEAYRKEYATKSKIIEDGVRFLQIYKIKIHEKKKRDLNLVYRIEKGEFNTYPILFISPDSKIPMAELEGQELLKLLYAELNKIKAQNKMMVNLFSAAMVKDLKLFIQKIYKNGFTQEEGILLFEGIDPEVSEPSKVIEHYKQKASSEKLIEVEPNELIITYVKPIYGRAGLNAMGQRIEHGRTNNHAKIEYNIDTETIEVKENKNEIRYYAKKRGFVSTVKNTLSISNRIVIEDLKRSEGKLTQKEENQVTVVISQTDVTRDGVGEGVELVSENIHITGHMGAKSSIEAKDVIIDGATHHDAFVTAKNAKINRHKGTLRCHKAEITSLEGGTVYATTISVNTTLGGQIYAEHVNIKSVKHNLKIYASKSITIERVMGEDNFFVIDYRKLPVLQSKLHYLNEEYSEIKWEYEDAQKRFPEKLKTLKEKMAQKSKEIDDIKLSHYNAVITIMAPINGLNTIEFAVAEKQQTLSYKTKEPGKSYEAFHLRKTEDKIILEPVGVSLDA